MLLPILFTLGLQNFVSAPAPALPVYTWQNPQKVEQKVADADEEKHKKELADDVKLGAEYVKDAEKEFKYSKNESYVDRVRKIGADIAEIANKNQVSVSWGDKRLNPFEYKFNVIEGKDINAFSLPGGYIFVYEGLVKYAETDDELAGVLAHEVSHASFRHIATLRREAGKLQAVTLPLILISILTGNIGAATGAQLFEQAVGSGWSVKAEQSADLGAFQYMRMSKYNVLGLYTFMERLAFEDRFRGNVDWGIYQTHPPSDERAEALKNLLVKASIPIKRSQVSSTLSAQIKENTDKSTTVSFANINVISFFGKNSKERAVWTADQLNAFFDREPKLYDAQCYGSDAIEGKGETLIQLTEDDAEGAKVSLQDLAHQTLNSLKVAIATLDLRCWKARRPMIRT